MTLSSVYSKRRRVLLVATAVSWTFSCLSVRSLCLHSRTASIGAVLCELHCTNLSWCLAALVIRTLFKKNDMG